MNLRLLQTSFLLILFMLLTSASSFAQCWNLVWSDEFSGTNLDTKNWNIEVNGDGGGNNELQYYTNRTENVRLENGNLVLEARKEAYSGKSYTSGRVTTQNKQFWKYGKFETRMKLPYGQGIWPAYWMLGESIKTLGWPRCGEMDIMEMIGGNDKRDFTTYGTFHWAAASNGSHASYGKNYVNASKLSEAYHTYTLEWSEKEASVSIDENKYYTIALNTAEMAVFKENYFLLFNLAVGGNWPGAPDGNTVFPQKMEIDYIRVYSGSGVGGLTINGPSEVTKGQTGLKYSLPNDPNNTYAWSLPVGASAIGSTTSNEITVNWACNAESISCLMSTPCGNKNIVFPIKVKDLAIDGTTFFVPTTTTDLQFSVPATANASYTWELPGDLAIASGVNTNSIHVNWATATGKVKVAVNSICGLINLERPMLSAGTYPYPNPTISHVVPGTIMATDYNFGGEGTGYHDIDASNNGTGVRANEGVDTQEGDGATNVGWMEKDEWMLYTVKTQSAGEYITEFRIGSLPGGGEFSILVDGKASLSTISVPTTGAWDAFLSIFPGKISLPAGESVVKVLVTKGGFNLSKIIIKDNDTEAPSTPTGLIATPTTNSISLKWTASTDNQQIKGYKIFKNSVLVATVMETMYQLSDLTANTAYNIEVVAIDLQGNSSIAAKIESSTLVSGIADFTAYNFKFYPNPVKDILNLQFNASMPQTIVKLIDTQGRELEEFQTPIGATEMNINLSKIAKGAYILQLLNNKGSNNYHLIKD